MGGVDKPLGRIRSATIILMEIMGWNLKLEDSDIVASRLERLRNRVKPHSDADVDYHFFEVVRELIISTLFNYDRL
jgi:hypothetical protein